MDALGIYSLTFNCARNLVDVDNFAQHFFDALPASGAGNSAPDLIFLSLQEIAPIAYSFLGGSYLEPYFDAFRRAVSKAAARRWDHHYENFLCENTGMTGLMLFARHDTIEQIAWKDTAHVGFGVSEMGNKGAVGARLGYVVEGNSSKTVDLTFVAAHLAPMEDSIEQRNMDWKSIVERLVFTKYPGVQPESQSEVGEQTGLLNDAASAHSDHSRRDLFAPNAYLFVAGDLNYRTSDTGPSLKEIVHFPRRNAGLDDPSHYTHLLKNDQLTREMRSGRSFHGLTEAPIDFPPTYKYSDAAREAARQGLDTDQEWKWSSHRWPSWCDRILYLDTPAWVGSGGKVQIFAYEALPLFAQSDHRPVALVASVPLRPSGENHARPETRAVAPFSIDPNWQARRDMARRKEIVVGAVAYLGLTWEGNRLLFVLVGGLFGAWLLLRSM
jgi:hypothetical protein